jgi:phosphoglycerate kinase
MKSIKSIKSLKDKTVLLRADFNVPINKDGKIEDTFRIDKTLPTLDHLLKLGGKVVIISHLGDDGSETLFPVAQYLAKKKYKGYFDANMDAMDIQQGVDELQAGEILLIENIRGFDEEKKNDIKFAGFLASLADIYVNDAFSVSHRKHASIVGVPKLMPSYAGLQLEEEVRNLNKALKPKHPFLFILGGAKFDTKLPLLKKYVDSADAVFVGGALANTLLKERGFEIGTSLSETGVKGLKALAKNPKILLPMDVIVENNKKYISTEVEEIIADDCIVDIGTETLTRIKPLIEKAKLIVWNGPLGKIDDSTIDLLKLLAKSKAEVIIGGGDTVEIISQMKMHKKFTFVSTGGGATLDYLANGTLPGIQVLK